MHLSATETRKLLTYVEHCEYRSELTRRRDTAMIYVLVDTGIRESELLGLKLSDVDLSTRELCVSEQSKGRRARYVWVSEETAENCEHISGSGNAAGEYLWTTRQNTPLVGRSCSQSSSDSVAGIGRPDLTVHGSGIPSSHKWCGTV